MNEWESKSILDDNYRSPQILKVVKLRKWTLFMPSGHVELTELSLTNQCGIQTEVV